jgi:PAS domain-containing protein
MTDWKLAGEELARSEQKFKDLVENTSDWIWESTMKV